MFDRIRMVFSAYPQTWALWARWSKRLGGEKLYRGGQSLCGKLTGHSPSKTEWGYSAGSDHADCWCRWCNHMGKVSLKDLDRTHPKARNAVWSATDRDIRQSCAYDAVASSGLPARGLQEER